MVESRSAGRDRHFALRTGAATLPMLQRAHVLSSAANWIRNELFALRRRNSIA